MMPLRRYLQIMVPCSEAKKLFEPMSLILSLLSGN